MNPRKLLSLLLLGLFCLGLASVALPEENENSIVSLYDGDEDDAGLPAPGRTDAYFQYVGFALISLFTLPRLAVGRLRLAPRPVRAPTAPHPLLRLTRAPPVR